MVEAEACKVRELTYRAAAEGEGAEFYVDIVWMQAQLSNGTRNVGAISSDIPA